MRQFEKVLFTVNVYNQFPSLIEGLVDIKVPIAFFFRRYCSHSCRQCDSYKYKSFLSLSLKVSNNLIQFYYEFLVPPMSFLLPPRGRVF